MGDDKRSKAQLLAEIEELRSRNAALEAERKRAEKEPSEGEEWYRDLVKQLPDIVWRLNRRGVVTFVSPSVKSVSGYEPDELVGLPFDKMVEKFVSAENAEEARGLLSRRLQGELGEEDIVFELGFRHKEGGQFIGEVYSAPLLGPDGNLKGVQGIVRDVTERRGAEEALRESEERNRLILDAVSSGGWDWDLKTGAVFFSNKWLQSLGYTREETIADANFWESVVHPEDLPRVQEALKRHFEGHTEHYECEHRLRMKSGEYRPNLDQGQVVEWDDDGKPVRMVGTDTDITQRQRTEEALKARERQLSMIYDSVGDALYFLAVEPDDCFRFLSINRVFLDAIGLTEEQVVHKRIEEVIPEPAVRMVRDNYKKAIEENRIVRWEETSKYPAGVRTGEVSIAPILDDNGNCIYLVGSVHDITERIQAEEERLLLEEQMLHTQKLESLGVLAGGIAHDFNNILHVILGNADLVLAELAPEGPGRTWLKEIRVAARRAAELTDEMLAYAGKRALVLEKLDLGDLVRGMSHLLESSHSKKVRVNYHFEKNLPAVEADPSQLRQVVMNLIVNASDAIGDEAGMIEVRTGESASSQTYLRSTFTGDGPASGRYVYLEVSDTGSGMDEETQDRIFEPFFTTKFTGRGLGMAAVLGIIRSHRGAIDIESEAGRGTTIKVLLPALDESVEPTPDTSLEEDDWRGHGTVLVVDDDAHVLKLQQITLEQAGFLVLTAANGPDAVDVFQDHLDEIVCVLLDFTMPRMDGEETYAELRSIRTDVPVILLSGYSEKEIKERCAKMGFAGCLKKPCLPGDLIKKLREVLEPDSGPC